MTRIARFSCYRYLGNLAAAMLPIVFVWFFVEANTGIAPIGSKQLDQDDNQSSTVDSDESKFQLAVEELQIAPKTADEIMRRMELPLAAWSTSPELSESEMNKIVEQLRNQYPFESIRSRLSRNSEIQPRNQSNSPDVQTSPFQDVVAADETKNNKLKLRRFINPRAAALQQLHSKNVREFINRAGNGITRIPPISPYSLPLATDYTKRIRTENVDPSLLGETPVQLKVLAKDNLEWNDFSSLSEIGMPTENLMEYFHRQTTYGFVGSYSLGFVKSIDAVAGFEAHKTRFVDWDQTLRFNRPAQKTKPTKKLRQADWTVNQLQLVSLLLHDEPIVYVSDNLPNMQELNGANTENRNLNAFELESLSILEKGEDYSVFATPNRIVMVGAIKATENCLQCHLEKEKGDLLGAFSYEFLRTPRLKHDLLKL